MISVHSVNSSRKKTLKLCHHRLHSLKDMIKGNQVYSLPVFRKANKICRNCVLGKRSRSFVLSS